MAEPTTPRWTEVIGIVRDTIDTHERVEMRVIDGRWRAICDCDADLGPIPAGPLIGSGNDEAVGLHEEHRARAVLAALADAGLLVTPGVWSLPAEPGPGVTAVRDRHSRRWTREPDGWIWREGRPRGLLYRQTWEGLHMGGYSPLTDATGEAP